MAAGKRVEVDDDRTEPKRMPPDWQPRGPAWSAVFGDDVQQVVMAYFGVQSATAETPPAMAHLEAILARSTSPDHVERARYIDEAGFTTTVVIAYWLDAHRFDSWTTGSGFQAWWGSRGDDGDGLGYFVEIIGPTRDRF